MSASSTRSPRKMLFIDMPAPSSSGVERGAEHDHRLSVQGGVSHAVIRDLDPWRGCRPFGAPLLEARPAAPGCAGAGCVIRGMHDVVDPLRISEWRRTSAACIFGQDTQPRRRSGTRSNAKPPQASTLERLSHRRGDPAYPRRTGCTPTSGQCGATGEGQRDHR